MDDQTRQNSDQARQNRDLMDKTANNDHSLNDHAETNSDFNQDVEVQDAEVGEEYSHDVSGEAASQRSVFEEDFELGENLNQSFSEDAFSDENYAADDLDDQDLYASVSSAGRSVFMSEVSESPEQSEPTLLEANSQEMALWSDYTTNPQWADGQSHEHADTISANQQESLGRVESGEDFFGYDDSGASFPSYKPPAAPSKRDMRLATVVGVVLIAAFFGTMWIGNRWLGPVAVMILVTLALGLASLEFYRVLRLADYQPAVLLGLAGVVLMPWAVYWRGIEASAVVIVLTIIFGSLWYIMGVSAGGTVRGLGTTVLGVCYIGFLGSYAALMLRMPDQDMGLKLLTSAVVFTVAYDVGGLAMGRSAGRNRLSKVSPNKTWEGLVGGFVVTCIVGVGWAFVDKSFSVFMLACAAAVFAPIGDLAESALKRDLGLKDMGRLLPGHGGALDRFDGHLFVLPATYYMAMVTGMI